MLCNTCNIDIYENDELKCSTCNGYFHFGCVQLREATFRKMSKNTKQKWSCVKCKFINDSNDSNTKSPTMNFEKGNDAKEVTNESFVNLTDSVNFMSEKFDTFGNQLKELLQSMKDLREENRILKEQNYNLGNDLSILQKKMNILEQKSLDNFVEIVNVPEVTNEVCKNTVEKIAKSLKVEIDVINAYRVQSKFNTKSKKIVAELSSKRDKKELIENARKFKPTGNSVDVTWKNEAIYINDNLTPFNRNLFFITKSFARDFSYKFVWFKDNKLFLKKNELSKAIVIDSELSLNKLK